jgi:L-ascorbate metabolism protein UlaG (beta-lactamase superfamily)
MRLTKFSHACVRLEHDGAVLVMDPGTLSEREALDGADAVLITHEHVDHLDVEALGEALARRPSVDVYAHPEVVAKLADLPGTPRPVLSGDRFTAAGFTVRAYGGLHALIHPDVPRIANLGFYVEEARLYHPGDSFDVPDDAEVDTLFVPVSAPWLKIAESIDFTRQVAPRRAYALHDALYTDVALSIVGQLMGNLAQTEFARLTPGTAVDV